MRMLEGFSGSGRLAQTFRHGGWEADTVDIKDGQDIMKWEPTKHYVYAHFAPPCQGYSALRYDYGSIWDADVALWRRAEDIVRQIRPRFWSIENVKMAQWIHGRAAYHYGPFFFWGYFPKIQVEIPWTTSLKGTHFDRATGRRWNDKMTPEQRAEYPQKLCDAIFLADESGSLLEAVEPSAQRSPP